MFWPFKRKEKQPDLWDRAAERLIAQGLDPKEVRAATKLVQRYARQGILPDGVVEDPEAGRSPGDELIRLE